MHALYGLAVGEDGGRPGLFFRNQECAGAQEKEQQTKQSELSFFQYSQVSRKV